MGRDASDEAYVLDLCDRVLGISGLRQHRFDWLLGDPGKSGRRMRLPVDAYWPDARLVVEYRELQHERPTPHFDKPDRMTISGVHRGIQRALYDARRDEQIPANGLRLVIIRPSDLDATPPAGGSDEAVPAILTPSKAFWIKPANAVAVFGRLGSRHTATCSGADRMAVGRDSPGHSPAFRSNAPALIISAIRGGVSLPGSASSTIAASKISSGAASPSGPSSSARVSMAG
jgi:hypothetical protein